MKTAAVAVKSVPDNLLDEVLGPLPKMPERKFWHLGHPPTALCGEPVKTILQQVWDGRVDSFGCPDCLRKAGR